MSRKKIHKKTALPLPLKIAIAVLLALLLLFFGTFCVALAAVRSADAGFRETLCGTMAEKNRFYTDWFFTGAEIAQATAYTAPAEASEAVSVVRTEDTAPEADGYLAVIYEISSDALSLGTYSGTAAPGTLSIGLAEYPGMVFADGTLFHTAETDYERIGFCGMTADGVLHIGAQSPTDAVNAGYLWGIACSRVLVSGGVLQTGLRGGYGVRAAIGQRADGSLFLVTVQEKTDRLYPRGMTYDRLAGLCYAEGAVNAAALPAAEKMLNGTGLLGEAPGTAGYALTAVLSGN